MYLWFRVLRRQATPGRAIKLSRPLTDGDFWLRAKDSRAGRSPLFEDGQGECPRRVLRRLELRGDSHSCLPCCGRLGAGRGQGDWIWVRSAESEHEGVLALGTEMGGHREVRAGG